MTAAVVFSSVSKIYPRSGEGYRTLRDVLSLRRGPSGPREPAYALHDVSFEVQPGDAYALIGPNGAGKSTALRLVARISRPTAGTVTTRGRVGALMEVGSGIHPELTGRENIWMYGSILGIPRAQIRRRFDDILDFAELREAVDRQVRYYSSGMQLRLGFAIASHLEPDVFVVDEALAVGDISFQSKCVERMNALVRSGTTLLFVSHNLPAIEGLCNNGVYIDRGRVMDQGPVAPVLRRYLDDIDSRAAGATREIRSEGPLRLLSVELLDSEDEPAHGLRSGDELRIRFNFEASSPVSHPHINLGLSDGRPGLLAQWGTIERGLSPARVTGRWSPVLRLHSLPLRPRVYTLYCDVFTEDLTGKYVEWQEVATLRVAAEDTDEEGLVAADSAGGPILVEHTWDVSDMGG